MESEHILIHVIMHFMIYVNSILRITFSLRKKKKKILRITHELIKLHLCYNYLIHMLKLQTRKV